MMKTTTNIENVEHIRIMIENDGIYEVFTDDGETITQDQLQMFLSLFSDHNLNHESIQDISSDTNLSVKSFYDV
jgi:hypothetical protein